LLIIKMDENTPPTPEDEHEKKLRLKREYMREYMRRRRAKLRELNPKPPKPPPPPPKPKKIKKPPPPPKPKRVKMTKEELYKRQLERQNKKVTCECGSVVSHGNLRVHKQSLKHKKLMAKLSLSV
jgi:hypothetical protein